MVQPPRDEADPPRGGGERLLFRPGPEVDVGTERRLAPNNDFAPTFVDIANGTTPDFVDGRSILPILQGDPATWRTAIMNERPIQAGHGITPYHAIISERYTYAEYTNTDKELYDRDANPYQLASLHNDPDSDTQALRGELSQRLAALKT